MSLVRQPRSLFSLSRKWQTCASTRTLASLPQSDLLKITHNKDSGIATMEMMNSPVNALTLPLLNDIITATRSLNEDTSCRALILTSGLSKKTFCAGLDITQFIKPDYDTLTHYWRRFQDMWLAVYTARPITVAAINGNAPAGGCVLSLLCDFRIMAKGKYVIGLNETMLGITPPFWVIDTFQNICGQRETEAMLPFSSFYNPDTALRAGLVDEVVDGENLMVRAQELLTEKLKLDIPDAARATTKLEIRKPTVDKFMRGREAQCIDIVQFMQTENFQAMVNKYFPQKK